MVTESLEQAVLAKDSSQPQSSYEAAITIIEFELKKILIDKIDKRGRGGRCKTLGVSLGGAAVSADLGGSSKYSNENLEGRRGESVPTLETSQSEVGSSGWKSTARRAVSGKGSRQNGSVTSGKGLALRVGYGGPSFEPVSCRRTARTAHTARVGRRVPARGRTENGSFGGLPRASNNQLRTGTDKGNLSV
ncbi:hypothetical protein Tco_0092527 [Tanacetum coccineum]